MSSIATTALLLTGPMYFITQSYSRSEKEDQKTYSERGVELNSLEEYLKLPSFQESEVDAGELLAYNYYSSGAFEVLVLTCFQNGTCKLVRSAFLGLNIVGEM